MQNTLTRAATRCIVVAFTVIAAATATQFKMPFGKWDRLSEKPIISPQGNGFESAGTFNPTVVKYDGKFVMLYRAQDLHGKSSLGYATSDDGVHFAQRPEPVMAAEATYETGGGVEDPRVVRIGHTFYLTYTAYNNQGGQGAHAAGSIHGDAHLCLSTSTDLVHWKRQGIIMPAYKGTWNVGWTKSGAIVPEKINGKYWMYFLGTSADKTDQTGLAYSIDLIHWTEATETPVLPRRAGRFDSRVVEPGPPPIIAKDELVLIYNAADDKLVYR